MSYKANRAFWWLHEWERWGPSCLLGIATEFCRLLSPCIDNWELQELPRVTTTVTIGFSADATWQREWMLVTISWYKEICFKRNCTDIKD